MFNKNSFAVLVIGVHAFICVFGAVSTSKASVDPYLDGQMKIIESKIDKWERTSREIECLTYAVVAIGIIVAASQALNKGWIKVGVATLGVMSALIVAFDHIFFPADDRAFQKVARQARSKLQAFGIELAQYTVLDDSTRKGLYQKFAKLIQDVADLENAAIYNGGTPPTASVTDFNSNALLATTARADQGTDSNHVPAWAQKKPADDKNLYFLGIADGTTFEIARQNALTKARETATEAIAQAARESAALAREPQLVTKIAKALADSAEVAETFTAPASASGYRAFTLLRLSKSAAVFTAQSIFVESSVPYDKLFLERVQKDFKY